MSDLSGRLDSAEEKLQEQGGGSEQDCTIYVLYDRIVVDPDSGDFRAIPGKRLPDDQYVFSEYGERFPDGKRFRTAYPRTEEAGLTDDVDASKSPSEEKSI